jgi:integrase/recombinase XerC
MSEYGELDYEQSWQSAPLSTYIEHKRERDDLTTRRLTQLERIIDESPDETDYESWDETTDWRDGMSVEDGWQFLTQLRAAGLAERTIEEYTRIVQSFLQTLLQRGVVDSNPVAYVRDETTFEGQTTAKVERTVSDVGEFLRAIPEPQYRAAGVLFAKTGIRNGECVNIDLGHLNLDHAGYQRFLDKRGVSLHSRIAEEPDSLYVPTEPTMGESYRGEYREAGNKRKRSTVFPLDTETKRVLLDWLAQRPLTASPHPLWTGKQGRDRISMHSFGNLLTGRYAAESGFVSDSNHPGFTPHWFRHMFTTQLKPGHGDHPRSVEPTTLRYLRGDVISDITSVYTHDWGNTIRPAYLDAIYTFDLFE